MQFGLLLSNLPHVEESRSHYNDFLSLQPRHADGFGARVSHRFGNFWQRLKTLAA
jgi:hypothetical protein